MWCGVTHWQKRWRSRSQYSLGLVLSIAVMMVIVRVLIRTMSLPKMLARLDTESGVPPRSTVAPDTLVRLTRHLLYLSRPRRAPNCMTQSLTAFYFLRKWGHPVQIHFGVAKRDDTLAGHCWLELHDLPLSEPTDPRDIFTTVVTFPQSLVTEEEAYDDKRPPSRAVRTPRSLSR